ncbi:N-acetylglucosamine kinase [Paenibacillus radicis (ex Xue et al. 2023)]|uniref:ATPase n=1 Tax=Paenibacillus radicis (ex Xue et al. 2023) TaxID=2972489 RepID=A0ABT1YME4_9BACL|nr:BadF/BadG/BcrA/BcrD ATPase family protein [Paenibacillus radicis (ex Xue et al. 2023)]MCR8634342.1 ATPase [Paenibacillus radicis (ex Xue et al. 2023)]
MMPYLMGIDGGGSKTYTVVTDGQGNRLGQGISGRSNHQNFGVEQAMANISESIAMALAEAQLVHDDIAFVQYGLAGADRQKDFDVLLPALGRLPFASWDLVCDTMTGLRAGSPTNTGVVLVCGNGTNAAGRNREGRTVQTGGLGPLYGDRTSGTDLARETFSSAVRSWELRERPSLLTDRVPRYFGFDTMEALVNDFLDRDVRQVPGELTIVLHQAADEGDELAIELLRGSGKELGIAANSVIQRLGGFGSETVPIVLVGSVVQEGRNPHLLQALKETIAEKHDAFELVVPQLSPVYGSVLLAMDRLQLPVTDIIMNKFIAYGGYKS